MPGRIVWNEALQRWESAPAGGAGVTVDNQSDPPAEVTTLIAPGATLAPDEATLGLGPLGADGVLSDVLVIDGSALDPGSSVVTVSAPANASGTFFKVQIGNGGSTKIEAIGNGAGGIDTFRIRADYLELLAAEEIALGTGSAFIIFTNNSTVQFLNANIQMGALPTVDPAVAGRLWVDAAAGNVVKRSGG
jgi:hypothetical protein